MRYTLKHLKSSLLAACVGVVVACPCIAQLEWRFGFEDSWGQIEAFLNPAQRQQLLERMAEITRSQEFSGDVNVNGLAGGWHGMQRSAAASVDFSRADEVVRNLQQHGFSMLWNLRINATWAKAGNTDCLDPGSASDCAPGSEFEADLRNYIEAIVERYDGDGLRDMGFETPLDPTDDLTQPVRFYLMPGEIEFVGGTPPPQGGYGDAATNHFWSDSTQNLLRTHRIVHAALHAADPSGKTALVSSGGVFWDLYSDFPDWPQTEGTTVQARLAGQNNHNANYQVSFQRLKTLLTSFGDDSDGVECDYVGWHPHMPWREVDQAFSFIRQHAGSKPIYVDDMWANIFLEGGENDSPGNTLFTGGGSDVEGDFPNELVPSYEALRAGVIFENPAILSWYNATHSRRLVKAFASAFGEGAERVSLAGNADFAPLRTSLVGHINPLGTAAEGFHRKPAFYTYQMLVDKLRDFTAAEEIDVSADPRTRVYRFDRPRGPVYIGWSETGTAPPQMDYTVPNGETVSFSVTDTQLVQTHLTTDSDDLSPPATYIPAPGGVLSTQLGYEPVVLETVTLFRDGFESS